MIKITQTLVVDRSRLVMLTGKLDHATVMEVEKSLRLQFDL